MVFNLDLNLEKMLKIIGWEENSSEYNSITIRHVLREILQGTKRKEELFPFKVENKYPHNKDVFTTVVKEICRYFESLKYYEIVTLPIPTKGDVSIISEPISNALYHNFSEELVVESYHASPDGIILRVSSPGGLIWDYRKQIEEYLRNPRSEKNTHKAGFHTFNNVWAIVSYDNGGRDFLALFKDRKTF